MNPTPIQNYKAGHTIYHISPYNSEVTEGEVVRILNNNIIIRWKKSGNSYSHYVGDPLFKYIITCCNQP